MANKKHPIIRWDTCDQELVEYEAKGRIEMYRDLEDDYSNPEYEGKTDEELLPIFIEEVENDPYFWQSHWENEMDYLTDIMNERHQTGYWRIEGSNMGWMQRSGYKYLEASTGKELMDGILPDTDCTFEVYKYQRGYKIKNWHHDAPMGESYIVLPVAERTYYQNK